MATQKDFDSFLSNIEPSSSTVKYISSAHTTLRDYLAAHSTYGGVHVQTFLSGSYVKNTSIRPKLNDGKRDVDIVVETTYTSSDNSIKMLGELRDTLLEKSTYSSAKLQSHSVGIELGGVDIDVVPVAGGGPNGIFYLGTSDKNEWVLTDPKGHIAWSSQVNADNNQMYKPLVKTLKWWRRTHCPDNVKYPKGLTLEKLIADNLPSSSLSTEDYLVAAMQAIVDSYQTYLKLEILQKVADPCLAENDLLSDYKFSDFRAFIDKLSSHLKLLAEDGRTNESWRVVLGNEFSKGDSTQNSLAGYQSAEQFIENMFPVHELYSLKIDCNVTQDGWRPFRLLQHLKANNGFLRHNKSLEFLVEFCNVPYPYSIYWKVRNVGEVAMQRNCIRGKIEKTDSKHHNEKTNFFGPHFVECYIVKNGVCVARDRIDVPIGHY